MLMVNTVSLWLITVSKNRQELLDVVVKNKLFLCTDSVTSRHWIDGLDLFWISWKIAHAHISGKQNKNELKKKNTQKVVNIQWTEFPPVSYLWFWYVRQVHSIWMYKLEVNYFFTILLYTFSERISWARNNIMVTAKNDRLRK